MILHGNSLLLSDLCTIEGVFDHKAPNFLYDREVQAYYIGTVRGIITLPPGVRQQKSIGNASTGV